MEIADASKPRPSEAVLPATAAKHLLVLNKTDLGEALDALGEIPVKVDTEDLLGVIFSSFCIGK